MSLLWKARALAALVATGLAGTALAAEPRASSSGDKDPKMNEPMYTKMGKPGLKQRDVKKQADKKAREMKPMLQKEEKEMRPAKPR